MTTSTTSTTKEYNKSKLLTCLKAILEDCFEAMAGNTRAEQELWCTKALDALLDDAEELIPILKELLPFIEHSQDKVVSSFIHHIFDKIDGVEDKTSVIDTL